MQHTAAHCNTLQHTATHCNTLQHTATHCNTLQLRVSSLCFWIRADNVARYECTRIYIYICMVRICIYIYIYMTISCIHFSKYILKSRNLPVVGFKPLTYIYTYIYICMNIYVYDYGVIAKDPYKRDDILQERPIILRSLLIVATPYVCIYMCLTMSIHAYLYVCIHITLLVSSGFQITDLYIYTCTCTCIFEYIYEYVYSCIAL